MPIINKACVHLSFAEKLHQGHWRLSCPVWLHHRTTARIIKGRFSSCLSSERYYTFSYEYCLERATSSLFQNLQCLPINNFRGIPFVPIVSHSSQSLFGTQNSYHFNFQSSSLIKLISPHCQRWHIKPVNGFHLNWI